MIDAAQKEAMIEAGYIDRETNSFTDKGILQGLFGIEPGTPYYEAEAAMLRRAETDPVDAIERDAAELRANLDDELR